ncbi:MAG: TolC family protein [Planctomycetales bacterium]|nr:TolC family protein [Planctomycetales bacterium]
MRVLLVLLVLTSGCSRCKHFRRADEATYGVIHQKTQCAPWRPPAGFNIQPDQRSRFYDPTCVVDPMLPVPAPRIYGYSIPELVTLSAPNSDRNMSPASQPEKTPDPTGAPQPKNSPQPPQSPQPPPQPTPVTHAGPTMSSVAIQRLPAISPISPRQPYAVIPASHLTAPATLNNPQSGMAPVPSVEPGQQPTGQGTGGAGDAQGANDQRGQVGEELPAPPPSDDDEPAALGPDQVRSLTADTWESLPESCLRRMLEFESVRSEYAATYQQEASPPQTDDPRLHLPAIVELALINSREYQTQKETLYRVALRLTLERYAYELQFFPRGNGTDVTYDHARNAGNTVNTLGVPTALGVQKVTRRGADVLAQFANDVVLTFNGPAGFTSRIGSTLLFQLTQNVLQRDVIFESLTQAERDVVYAARTFARFRKQFFVDFAQDYYSLLLTYRSIEINSFDYFSNQREFLKGLATFQAGKMSRIQVDQFEQNALRSRSNLVRSCNSLERALDNLKISMGVPPEMQLNLDLSELDRLTRRDSLAATFEQASRNRHNLEREMGSANQGLAVTLNLAKLYTENLLQVIELRQTRDEELPGSAGQPSEADGDPGARGASDGQDENEEQRALAAALVKLDTLEALLKVGYNDEVLRSDLRIQPPVAPLRLFQRRVELAVALLEAKRLLLQSPEGEPAPRDALAPLDAAAQRIDKLSQDLSDAIQRRDVDGIDNAVAASEPLLRQVVQLANIAPQSYTPATLEAALRPVATALFAAGDRLGASHRGLSTIEIEMDEAMLTAATQRYELASVREQLADTWRQIKLRGDNLKAVVNWSFRQAIRTPSAHNRPFSFTFDESDTRLSLSFDAPLNRFRERNAFRQSLIDYNQQLRQLIQSEDQVKLAIRNDLRNLQLDRDQYEIAVASAALAAGRVRSTRERLKQGSGTARDFLEAQQAYTESLNAVASQHIGFLVDRMQLFLDLEQLEVDELGFWPDLYNNDAQPLVRTEMPLYAVSIYGNLPCVKYSDKVKRMLNVPAGQPRIEKPLPAGPLEPIEAIEAPDAPQERASHGRQTARP